MKKIMAILALVIICQAGYSQKNVNDLFKEFSKMNNVTTISMGQITMKFASLFSVVKRLILRTKRCVVILQAMPRQYV